MKLAPIEKPAAGVMIATTIHHHTVNHRTRRRRFLKKNKKENLTAKIVVQSNTRSMIPISATCEPISTALDGIGIKPADILIAVYRLGM